MIRIYQKLTRVINIKQYVIIIERMFWKYKLYVFPYSVSFWRTVIIN